MVKDTDGLTVWSHGPQNTCDPGHLVEATYILAQQVVRYHAQFLLLFSKGFAGNVV